jgi:hypothetical protein
MTRALKMSPPLTLISYTHTHPGVNPGQLKTAGAVGDTEPKAKPNSSGSIGHGAHLPPLNSPIPSERLATSEFGAGIQHRHGPKPTKEFTMRGVYLDDYRTVTSNNDNTSPRPRPSRHLGQRLDLMPQQQVPRSTLLVSELGRI